MPTQADPLGGVEDEATVALRGERGGMMMIVPSAMWELVVHQAQAEGRRPGEILSDALTAYIREHGTPEAREFVRLIEDANEEARKR